MIQSESSSPDSGPSVPRPLGLVAELTYRCPLHCPYCSNPLAHSAGSELTTEEWRGVIEQAATLGVFHALFTGGEPLTRHDLAELISAAREAGIYTNLITSAVGLSLQRLQELKASGLESVQISFQSDEAGRADSIAGASAHALKLQAAIAVRELGLPLTINVVLHRGNIEQVDQMIRLAETLGASRLELAHVQFYGWAFRNRSALLPDRNQIERVAEIARAARERLRGRMEILHVLPDYFADRPKPCMSGWGRRHIVVNAFGEVLPCPTAFEIRSMKFDNVREHDLGWIWNHSESFNRFRSTQWMPEPCRSCDLRESDFGGCRCQAALLTGDAANTDPVCGLSPHHSLVEKAVDRAHHASPLPVLEMRQNPRSLD